MKDLLLILLAFSCTILSTNGSLLQQSVAQASAFLNMHGVNLMVTFFKDVKTIHLINIHNVGQIPVTPYIKHFHDCLGMSFTVATVVRKQQIAQFSQETIRNSHAEAYLVYVDAPVEYFTVLETVKRTNPLARCLFMFSKGSYSNAVERLRLAFERFELFNIVIASIDEENRLVWCIFNPFSGMHYNMATSTEHHTQLTDLRELNNFNGFPVTITIPHLQGTLFKKFPAEVNVLRTIFKMINVSCRFAVGGYQYGKGMRAVDIDSYPHLIHDVSASNVIFLNPLKQTEIYAAAPKNRNPASSPTDYVVVTRLYYRRVAILFCSILALFGTINRKLFGPALENEFTHLLLTGTGIMYNFGTYAFKDTKLRIVTVSLMFSAMIVNNILQGSLIEYLNVPVINEIDSLSKLLNANLNIVTVPFIYNSLRHVTGDRMVQQIKANLKILPLPQDRENPIFASGRYAFLLPKEKAHSMAETIYDDRGNDLLFIVPEKVHVFYVAFVARRDLFMEWKINQLILQMAQHGVIHYEFDTMFSSVRLLQIHRVREGKVAEIGLLTIRLGDLIKLLPLIVWAYLLSFLLLAVELAYNKFSQHLQQNDSNIAAFGKSILIYAMKKSYELLWIFIIYLKTTKFK